MTSRLRTLTRAWPAVLVAVAALAPALGTAGAAEPPGPEAAVQMTATDVDGKAVKVPEADRPTLLLFFMAGQPQSQGALEQVAAALEPKPTVQVVAVVTGQQVEAAAKAIKGKLPGVVVLDPDYALAGKMGVRAWPTTLIILPDGHALAHLAGLAKSFAKDLASYLDFVAGKIDRETLQKRLSTSQIIEDDPHQMARRHLEAAQRELAKGLLGEARQELERGLHIEPKDPDLQLANATLLLLEGQPEQALAALDKMDQASVPPWKVDALRGRALVALKQYDNALAVLQRAVRLNPEPGEAWYALGLLYEQRGEWQQAAKAFRTAFEATPAGRLIKTPEAPAKP